MIDIPNNVPEKNRSDYRRIKAALESESGMEKLRGDIRPLVENIVGRYSEKYNTPQEELIEAAWTHFEWAVERYWEHLREAVELGEEKYRFSTYFTHIIARSIQSHLGISDRSSEA